MFITRIMTQLHSMHLSVSMSLICHTVYLSITAQDYCCCQAQYNDHITSTRLSIFFFFSIDSGFYPLGRCLTAYGIRMKIRSRFKMEQPLPLTSSVNPAFTSQLQKFQKKLLKLQASVYISYLITP